MMIKDFKRCIAVLLLMNAMALTAQQRNLQVDLTNKITEIQPTMYGVFFEDINFAADGGLYAELIKNRSFEFTNPMMGWEQPNSDRHSFNRESGIATIVKYSGDGGNTNFCRVRINDDKGYALINEGFRGMGVKKDAAYKFYVSAAKHSGDVKRITVQLIDNSGEVLGEARIDLTSNEWKDYEVLLKADRTEANAKVRITFEGTGEIDLDMVSLFPVDTWKGREKGLRKDLVQLLYDMDPGFLRFPGGCIVEGRTLARRYQWKKTVGPAADRELLVNRWNSEFAHRPTPDYYQSFGLGFFEYFQLSEDLGAEPLPILSCGIACQFNSGELVPMDELDPYVQDALDLIEFANGSVDTPWGKVRKEMGHPEPFNLKYIGIGNEQWGPAYIERYKVFEKAIKGAYPDMIIVSGSGPFPDGDYFEYGTEELKKLHAEIIDEHYYRSPQWFRDNATRYDSYDRNGPKIFAGEYAAQSVAAASPDNKNNWECALSEAAFMTGLERNAEVVHLTSYAPLMAHAEGWQWTPDMIWFNNLDSYGTANYQVQKMYATNRGTDLVSITENNQPLTGQDDLYATAALDEDNKGLIVKLVNTSDSNKEVRIDLKGRNVGSKGTLTVLTSERLSDENSFEHPMKISPKQEEFKVKGKQVTIELSPQSFYVLNMSTK